MTDVGLAALFAPLSVDEFLNAHYPDEPCVGHGAASRFGAIAEDPGLVDLDALMRSMPRSIQAIGCDRDGGYQETEIEPRQAAALYRVGLTICFNGVHTRNPRISDLISNLETELGLAGDLDLGYANVYASPAGSGLPLHFDGHEVFICQVRGTKQWTIAPNLNVRYPTQNLVPGFTNDDELELYRSGAWPSSRPEGGRTVVLEPGSVLFVQRGYWHATEAGEPSVSITIGFEVPGQLELLLAAIRQRLTREERWRQPATLLWHRGEAGRQARVRLQTVLERLPADLAGLSVDEMLDTFPYRRGLRRARNRKEFFSANPAAKMRVSNEGTTIEVTAGDEEAEIDLDASLAPIIHWAAGRASFTKEELRTEMARTAPWAGSPAGVDRLLGVLLGASLIRRGL